jgi:hypothetical protein
LPTHNTNTICFQKKSLDKFSPRQFRYLDFIGHQFTTDVRHIAGDNNIVAYTLLSRPVGMITAEDYDALAASQSTDLEMENYLRK